MSGQRSVKLTLGSDERVFGSYRELEDYALAMRAPHLDAVDLIAKMAAGDLAWGLMWLWTKRCTVLIVLWTMRRMVRARIYPVRRTVRM